MPYSSASRSSDELLRLENDDLRTATSRNSSIVLDLSLDGVVRYLSRNWEDLIGTPIHDIIGSSISDVIVGNDQDKQAFDRAISTIAQEDTSFRIRFFTRLGPLAIDDERSSTPSPQRISSIEGRLSEEQVDSDGQTIDSENVDSDIKSPNSPDNLTSDYGFCVELEGQGILIKEDENLPSHTMWILHPYEAPEPLKIDLPNGLQEALMDGAHFLVSFLEELSDSIIMGLDTIPAPPLELCRICERNVPKWWFEGHCELCAVESKSENTVQLAHEALVEHRNTLSSLAAEFESILGMNSYSPTSIRLGTPESNFDYENAALNIQYRGHSLHLTQPRSPDLSSMSPPASPRLSGSTQGLLIKRNIGRVASPPSFKRSPLKLIELLVGLCDMALEVKTPEVKYDNILDKSDKNEIYQGIQIRTFSPVSEARIHQVLDWSYSQNTDDAGMALLFQDTANYARKKVDAAMRMGSILIYSERIRLETESMVQQAIDDTINRSVASFEGISDDEDKFEADDEGPSIEKREIENESMESDIGDTTVIIHPAKPVSSPQTFISAEDIFSDSYLHKSFPGDKSFESKKTASQSSNLRLSPLQLPMESPKLENLSLDDSSEKKKTVPRIITDQKSPSIRHSVGNIQMSRKNSQNVDGTWASPGNESHRTHLSVSDTSSFTSTNNDDFGIGDLDLNLSSSSPGPDSPISVAGGIAMHGRGRKSFSSANVSPKMYASSPLSSLHHRRHLTQSIGGSFGESALSPLSQGNSASPLLFPHDYDRHHRRQSSAVLDFSRAPVSPLLTASVPPQKPTPPSINDYEIVCPISKGAFGSVYLSRKKLTGEYFAIKVLKKADMIAKNQVMNVKSERAIMMAQEDSPFVAKLFFTFQNKDYLFLVMEYLNGGDCAALIKVLGGLPEEWTQKYIAEVVVAVDELHKRGIVHRDLKPENLLIDSKGHLKLIDFGLSKMGVVGRQAKQSEESRKARNAAKIAGSEYREPSLSRDPGSSSSSGLSSTTTGVLHDPSISLVPGYFSFDDNRSSSRSQPSESSGSEPESSRSGSQTLQSTLYDPQPDGQQIKKFVGTPDYLSPETIRGHGLAEMSDWWSLGCILFEFLYGYPPFHASKPSLVFQNILDRHIQWPEPEEECNEEGELIASETAKDLINKLLASDPTVRLGFNGVEEIKDHGFFKGIDHWDSLWDGEAGFIPHVEHPEDTDYFDSRGAAMQSFETDLFDDKNDANTSQLSTSIDSSDESSQSGSNHRVSTGANSPLKRNTGKPPRPLPLHIPPHVREGRSRRLSEPVPMNDFGSFSYKNLPVLEKANKELISKMKQESADHYRGGKNRLGSIALPMQTLSGGSSPSPTTSRHTSPTRQLSASSSQRYASSVSSSSLASPQKIPLLKPNGDESELSSPTYGDRFFRSESGFSPLRNDTTKKELMSEVDKNLRARRPSVTRTLSISNIRHGSVFDVSPNTSDTEDSRTSNSAAALLRVQKRRALSRKLSRSSMSSMRTGSTESNGIEIPILDILVCDINPVWRYSTERMLHKAGCRVVSVSSGQEALRRATGHVRFDAIILDFKLGNMIASDVSRLIRQTENPNIDTPIICLTSSSELSDKMQRKFNSHITRPPTEEKLVNALMELFPNWKPSKGKESKKKNSKENDVWLAMSDTDIRDKDDADQATDDADRTTDDMDRTRDAMDHIRDDADRTKDSPIINDTNDDPTDDSTNETFIKDNSDKWLPN